MNYIRTYVSGNKKRFIDEKFNLDLSYITNRIIAMAYPASGIEKVFKNSINSVELRIKLGLEISQRETPVQILCI